MTRILCIKQRGSVSYICGIFDINNIDIQLVDDTIIVLAYLSDDQLPDMDEHNIAEIEIEDCKITVGTIKTNKIVTSKVISFTIKVK